MEKGLPFILAILFPVCFFVLFDFPAESSKEWDGVLSYKAAAVAELLLKFKCERLFNHMN